MNSSHFEFLLSYGSVSQFLSHKDTLVLRRTCTKLNDMKLRIYVEPEFHIVSKMKKLKINKSKNILVTRDEPKDVYLYNHLFCNVNKDRRTVLYFKIDICKYKNMITIPGHYVGVKTLNDNYLIRFDSSARLEKIVKKILDEFHSYHPFQIYTEEECYHFIDNIIAEMYEDGTIDDMYSIVNYFVD